MKLDELIGQKHLRKALDIQLKACKEQKKLMPHILLQSEGGLGKSTWAMAIAKEIDLPFEKINTASLTDPLSIIYSFIDMGEGEMKSKVIFLDEVHNLKSKAQEAIYTAMEGRYISYEVQGNNGKEVKKQELPPFVLLAATTEGLAPSFQNRFKHVFQLKPYTDEEIQEILSKYKPNLNPSLISEYSRSNPRIAKKIADWIDDYHSVDGGITLTKESVSKAMNFIGIGPGGLTEDDKKYLNVLAQLKKSGVKNLSANTGLSESRITKEIEPFLIQRNYIFRTQTGRIINFSKIKDWKE